MRAIVLSLLVLCAPAATVSAQVAPARDEPFRVFFDWGKPELNGDARAALAEVADAYRRSSPARLAIDGHTDRSGSAGTNLRNSRLRAEAVKAHLATLGIPKSAMVTAGHGEARPIVPTEDGVREAQNRRVEIRFAGVAPVQPDAGASAALVLGDGSRAGTATLREAAGSATITIDATGLPPGTHGLHLHAVGRCDTPQFTSAGPHWNPSDKKHGQANPQGPHLGDLPNLVVGPDGRAQATIPVTPGSRDADGTALVIHADADDMRTDPSGNSGARIACAAFPG